MRTTPVMTAFARAVNKVFQPVINTGHRVTNAVRGFFNQASEFKHDVMTALRCPDAMKPGERRMDEMKIFVGAVGTVAGVFEGPIGPISGLAAIVEGTYHLEAAGQDYRLRHPTIPELQAPASGSPRP